MDIKYLRIASDLHLEAFTGRDEETLAIDFLPKDDRDAESVLVLAGDISSHISQLVLFLKACLKRFPHVVYVPGNHEFYKQNFDSWNKHMTENLPELGTNLHFSAHDVSSVVIDGVLFVLGTLWGDGGPTLQSQGEVGYFLNDFRLIKRDGLDQHLAKSEVRFTVQDMIEVHKRHKQQINETLLAAKSAAYRKVVVVTHHMPSRRLVSDRFWPNDGSDGANGGFVGDCESILAYDHAPDIWIHGHTHDTIDRELWNTRIICNPAGYRGEYATPFNAFMKAERREDGSLRAVVVPKFVEVE